VKRSEVRELYGREYAAHYDDKYLLSDLHRSDTEFELRTLERLLPSGRRWLDVACGTGFFLSRFPDHERAGCDLSPEMLERARPRNPGAVLVEHDFLEPRAGWEARWDLVSCMWYAYCYVDAMDDVWKLFDNLMAWTAPGGDCFVPYCDLNLIFASEFPEHQLPTLDPGELFLDGLVWSYREHSGEHHRQLFAPHPRRIDAHFAPHFREVEVVSYPPGRPEWERGRTAMVARGRR
jgi:SAM-dependent methyltransferase